MDLTSPRWLLRWPAASRFTRPSVCPLHRGGRQDQAQIDGADYLEVYPLGLVPLLRLDDGSLLSENPAILQYIAGRYPQAKLAPTDDIGVRGCNNGYAS